MTSFCIASSSVSHSLIETGILWSLSLTKDPESMAEASERGRAGRGDLWSIYRAFLHDEDAVVEMQRIGRPGELVDRQDRVVARVPAIEPVDQRLAVLEESSLAAIPAAVFRHERSVSVLAQIDPVRLDVRIQLLERGDLLRHGMSAVVDQDVDVRDALANLGKRTAVRLVADENGCRFIIELFASGIDVDADDVRPGAETVLPHLQRPAMEDADFDHDGRAAAKGLEVTMVDLEVVVPFVDQASAVAEIVLGDRIGRLRPIRIRDEGALSRNKRAQQVGEKSAEHVGRGNGRATAFQRCWRDMKIRRSNRCTSCSFFSSAPCSGGMMVLRSLALRASGGMSSASRSFSQSSSSEVEGFFLRLGTSRTSKNTSSASRSSDFLSPGKCTSTILSIVSLSGKRM